MTKTKVFFIKDWRKYKVGDSDLVSGGLARHYLFRRDLARPASKDIIAHYNERKEDLQKQSDLHRKAAEDLAEKIAGSEVVINRLVAPNGKPYGSVSVRDVREALAKQCGVYLDASDFLIDRPIKDLGEYDIAVLIMGFVPQSIKLLISEE